MFCEGGGGGGGHYIKFVLNVPETLKHKNNMTLKFIFLGRGEFFYIPGVHPLLRDKWMDNLSRIQDMKYNRRQHCRNITVTCMLISHNYNHDNGMIKIKCHQSD